MITEEYMQGIILGLALQTKIAMRNFPEIC